MSKCCVDCRQFVGVAGVTPDGIYKRDVRDGAIVWLGTDGVSVTNTALISALDAGYATAPIVDCSLFTSQSAREPVVSYWEEITIANNQPTQVVVRVEDTAGTLTYINVADGLVYDTAADPATKLIPREDADYFDDTEQGCDAGTPVKRITVYQAGSDAPTNSFVINVSTGAIHTLSGAETWGSYCAAGTRFTDPVIRCAKVRDATGVVAAGTATELVYEVVEVNSATGVPVGMSLTKVSDNTVVTEGTAATEHFVERGCC